MTESPTLYGFTIDKIRYHTHSDCVRNEIFSHVFLGVCLLCLFFCVCVCLLRKAPACLFLFGFFSLVFFFSFEMCEQQKPLTFRWLSHLLHFINCILFVLIIKIELRFSSDCLFIRLFCLFLLYRCCVPSDLTLLFCLRFRRSMRCSVEYFPDFSARFNTICYSSTRTKN